MTAREKLRGAIVGCGMIAEFHLRSWARIPEVEIVGLVDPNLAAAERYRIAYAPTARIYGDLTAMLAAEQLDFLDIATPPSTHMAHCLQAKEANLHVICQKPLCDELSDAQMLVSSFAASSKLFCVHENHVYRPWFQQVRALHRENFFGPLRWLRLEQNDPSAPPQKASREAKRGVLLEYGVHLADMIRALLGPPERVSAQLRRVHPDIRGESLAHVAFEYPEGTAVVDIAWKNGGFAQGGALFLGDQGEAFYHGTMIRGGKSSFRLAQGDRVYLDESRDTVADYVESFHSFQLAFVAAVNAGAPCPQPATENLRTLEMIFAAYESAETGRGVCFSEFCAAYQPTK